MKQARKSKLNGGKAVLMGKRGSAEFWEREMK